MKNILPHILIGKNKSGCVILKIEDEGLLDFIDDYLVERFNISFEVISGNSRPGGRNFFTVEFGSDITAEQIEQCLSDVSPQIIEDIFNGNNSGPQL